jgi:hypothetical protein
MTAPRRPSEEHWDEHELVRPTASTHELRATRLTAATLQVQMFTEILMQARERSLSPAQQPRSPSQILFDSIRSANIEPNWSDLVLPNGMPLLELTCDSLAFAAHEDFLCTNGSTPPGRTLSACQNVFRQFASSGLPSTAPQIGYPTAEPSSKKRPYPSDTITPTGRVLKPKPATYPESSRLSVSTQPSFPLSPLAEPAPALGEPRKKRGRPTKKEQEERRKQTAFQQQGFQSQDRPQAPQFHQTQVIPGPSSPPTAQTVTTPKVPSQEEPANSGSSGDKKRRGRPPRVAPTFEPSQIPITTTVAAAVTTTTTTTTFHEPPPQTPSTHDGPGSIAMQSESTTQPPASVAAESSTAVASGPEQQEETRRSTRPRIWEQ